jgi:ribosomal protein S18 acetylase RimI-like enzyme
MLYVDNDNEAGKWLYQTLGFQWVNTPLYERIVQW